MGMTSSAISLQSIFNFLGGIGLFLLGMRLMTDGLKVAAGPALRGLLTAATGSTPRALGAGALITALVQSSSAVIFAVIGFVNAGLLSLAQAVGLIFGANLGTTLTSWIVALVGFEFDLGLISMPAIAAGMMLWLSGKGRRPALGQALVDSPLVDGVTFTGSFDVGMKLFQDFGHRNYVRPVILELGGKNPTIVSRNANLEDAAAGLVRSAFGLQGQKCSAGSRIIVEAPVHDELVARLKELTEKLSIGDPTDRKTFLGPVMNRASYEDFQTFSKELAGAGRIVTGGELVTSGDLAHGYFCQPTLAADVPFSQRLWQHEMFVPIATIGKVNSLDEGMEIANSVKYGLTSGFYGSETEVEWFFENIQSGLAYANRPQGSTTGAWPGFQPFGGWKGSGSSGKNAGGHYYLPLYMHEQIHTFVKPKK